MRAGRKEMNWNVITGMTSPIPRRSTKFIQASSWAPAEPTPIKALRRSDSLVYHRLLSHSHAPFLFMLSRSRPVISALIRHQQQSTSRIFLTQLQRTASSFRTFSMSSITTAPIKIDNHETYLSQGIPSSSSLDRDPLAQFRQWFSEASSNPEVIEPEAMSISTVSSTGIPSTRVVLLKRVDEKGWVFFTNYESRKGNELFPSGHESNEKGGYASLAFYWRALHLSVRIVGRAEKISQQETKEYFDSRPIGSRIGAWASKQSSELQSREELEEQVQALERKFGVVVGTSSQASAVDVDSGDQAKGDGAETKGKDVEIPVPPFWGGVRIVPFEVEFWAGRPSRLHDRFRYTREEGTEGEWKIVRLSP